MLRKILLSVWLIITVVLYFSVQATAELKELAYSLPDYGTHKPPPPRAMADVEVLLGGSNVSKIEPPEEQKAFKLLLVAGPKDHRRGEHDYPAWQKTWSRLLEKAPRTKVLPAWKFPTDEQAESVDVMVFYQRGRWNSHRAKVIDKFLCRGGGLVYIHWAVDGRGGEVEFAKRIGLASKGGGIRFRHGPLDIDFSPAGDHPIARNFSKVHLVDEAYWKLTGASNDLKKNGTLLGTSIEDGQPQPIFWTVKRGRGRVFVSIPGHYMWSFDDPAFRLLLMRGIAWAGKRSVDRFNDLILLDARVARGTPAPAH